MRLHTPIFAFTLYGYKVSIRNRPGFRGGECCVTLLPKVMFNPNENNRIVMSQNASDMQAGVDQRV